jgi:serine/threonine protein kinase/formylglycine-generating enzyme required for sulfatase activity
MADPPPDLDRLVDDFQRRLRAGDAPSADEYAARYPHLADRIREVFPVVLALEQATTPPPAHPPRLGEFRLLREVGRGGMGIVYEAVQESLGRRVAVKVFPPAHAGNPALRERFSREAKAAGRLHHTHIVPVFGVGSDRGIPYFAMPFVPGGGLDRVILRRRARADRTPTPAADPTSAGRPDVAEIDGPAYFREVARLVREAADALAHAHAHGVQHRDIKPSNLLLGDDGTLWVTDFGLAKLDGAADLTATGDHLGTLRYCPPERFRGTADERADQYSLGATLYELLTLRAAFPDGDPFVLVDRIQSAVPPSPRSLTPEVPRDLDTICSKCLHKDPGRRYPSCAALAEDLRAFLEDRPITARRVGPAERLGRWAKRRPGLATGLAAAVVLAVVAVGQRVERDMARRAARADGLVSAVAGADTAALPPLFAQLPDVWADVREPLEEQATRPAADRAGRNARLALLPDRPEFVADLTAYLLDGPADELVPVRQAAGDHLRPQAGRLWAVLEDPAEPSSRRVRAAGLLAGLDPRSARWEPILRPLADLLVGIDPVELGPLARAVGPVLPRLADALMARYKVEQRGLDDGPVPPAELAARVGRLNAAAVLLWQTLADRPDATGWLVGIADDAHLPAVLATVAGDWAGFGPKLRAAADWPVTDGESARRRAGFAAVVLSHSPADDRQWEKLRLTPDPTVRSHLIRRLRPAGVPAAAVAARYRAEPDVTARRALLLALGDYPQVPADFWGEVGAAYRTHPEAGLHAAAGWLLRTHGRGLPAVPAPAGAGWWVAPHGDTFSVIPAPGRVRVGTPPALADDRFDDEAEVERDIPRSYAVAATEVTAGLYRRWPGAPAQPREDRLPAVRVTWHQAAGFCNWLSDQERIPPDQWCYRPAAGGGFEPVPGHLDRTGYRLPTEAEWEHAARAGCPGPRFFGDADTLLTRYAWGPDNARDRPHPVAELRPNDFGLFDVLGNALEWTDDRYADPYPTGPTLDVGGMRPSPRKDFVLRGGAYNLAPARLRSAYRYNLVPVNTTGSCGFRLCRTVQ